MKKYQIEIEKYLNRKKSKMNVELNNEEMTSTDLKLLDNLNRMPKICITMYKQKDLLKLKENELKEHIIDVYSKFCNEYFVFRKKCELF